MTLFEVSNLTECERALPAGKWDSHDSEMFIVSCQGKICPLPSHHGEILEEKWKKLVILEQGNSLASPVPSFLEEWQRMPWREHEARARQYFPRVLSSSQKLPGALN